MTETVEVMTAEEARAKAEEYAAQIERGTAEAITLQMEAVAWYIQDAVSKGSKEAYIVPGEKGLFVAVINYLSHKGYRVSKNPLGNSYTIRW